MFKFLLTAALLFTASAGFSLTADEILTKADGNRSVANDFEMKLRMDDYKKGVLSETTVMKGYIKGNTRSMVIYTEPSNMKDRKILMVGDEMWIIIPKTQRPVRLTPSQRILGQASTGDVVKVRMAYDYSPVDSGEEVITDLAENKRSCYKLSLSAKRESATYNKMTLWVEKETFYPVKAEFFALSGKKLKTAFYSEVRQMGEATIVSKMTIYDEIMKDNYTTIEFLSLQRAGVEDKYFNKDYLQRM